MKRPPHISVLADYKKECDDLHDTFVAKAFPPREFDQARHEMAVFSKTRKEDSIIGFYGSYMHGNTFHIILEFANEGTLEDFLHREPRPTDLHDIHVFWDHFLGVVNAVTVLHHVGREGGFCHHDITTRNILVSSREKKSNYDYRFILSDFGECRFRENMGIGRAASGTITYGAPELFDPDQDQRATASILLAGSQVDIWSLGCVLSEVATWIAFGVSGLEKYREMRRADPRSGSSKDLKKSDCFHDGVRVLPSVFGHHDNIRHALAEGDSMTGEVLGLVRNMLKRADDRFTAREARTMAVGAIQETQDMLGVSGLDHPIPTSRSAISQTTGDRCQHLGRSVSNRKPAASSSPPEITHRPWTNPVSLTSDRLQYSSIDNNSWAFRGSGPLLQGNQPTLSTGINSFSPSPSHSVFAPHDVPNPYMPFQSRSASGPFIHQRSPDASVVVPHGSPASASLSQASRREEAFTPLPTQQFIQEQRINEGAQHFSGRPSSNELPARAAYNLPDLSSIPVATGEDVQNTARQHLEAPTEASPNKFTPPHWKLSDISHRRHNHKPLPQGNWIDDLQDRDYLFLVDNSPSMRSHWDGVLRLVEPMAYMVKEYAKTQFINRGIELRFTYAGSGGKFSTTRSLMNEIRSSDPSARNGGKTRQWTDIENSLGAELDNYREALEDAHKPRLLSHKVRRKVIYVLTDGCWQPQSDIRGHIRDLVATLEEYKSSSKQIGVQFIQFGNDEDARNLLETYDYGLGLPRYVLSNIQILAMTALIDARDIVDTEPFTGDDNRDNLWKMFFGSINKTADQVGEER